MTTTTLLRFSTFFLFVLALSCGKQTKDPAPGNTFDDQVKGCGDFIVNRLIDPDMIVSVWVDQKKIAFSTDFQTFDDVANEDFARVELEQNCDIATVWQETCNDVAYPNNCTSIFWQLTKGKLSFKVSKVLDEYGCSHIYLATVILENAEFKKIGGNETRTFDKIEFNDVTVGWCAG